MNKSDIQEIKKFLKNFDPAEKNFDATKFPEGFANHKMDEVLAELSQEETGKFYSAKTFWDINQPDKPELQSRTWESPEGYRYLAPWSNAVLLRYLVRAHTSRLPKSEYRRKAQVDDAARSVVRNIEEGYKRSTTLEYLQFLGYSQGSLEEVKGDMRELTEDGFLKSRPDSSLADLGVILKELGEALKAEHGRYYKKNKGDYRNSKESKGEENSKGEELREGNRFRPLGEIYPPLGKLKAEDLTYEMFLELINKTDYLLRQLAKSLEDKLKKEGKNYQIEQARRKQKTFWKIHRKE